MRTTAVTLGGQEYLLCFSVRVSRACSERFGSVENIAAALSGKGETAVIDETIWLFSQLADAGYRYAKNNGLDTPAPLSEDDILDNFDVSELTELVGKVKAAISAGMSTNIDIQTEGNAQATRE